MPEPGSNVRWWQRLPLAIVGVAKLAWAFITGKPDNTENR